MKSLLHHTTAAIVVAAIGFSGCIDAPGGTSDAGPRGDVASTPDAGRIVDTGTEQPDGGRGIDLGGRDVTTSPDVGAGDMAVEDIGRREDSSGPMKSAALVVGNIAGLNESEELIEALLLTASFEVQRVDDNAPDLAQMTPDVFVISKSVESSVIGDSLRQTSSGILTWEERLLISDRLGLATEDGTTWRSATEKILINDVSGPIPSVLSGEIPYYNVPDNITWARCSQLITDASVLAHQSADGNRCTHFVVEAGGALLDGQSVAGRRAFAGFDVDSFKTATPGARQFFRTMLLWAAE